MVDLLRLCRRQTEGIGDTKGREEWKKGEKRVPKAAFDKGQAKQHLQLAPSAKLCFKKHQQQQQQEKRENPMKETERKQGKLKHERETTISDKGDQLLRVPRYGIPRKLTRLVL